MACKQRLDYITQDKNAGQMLAVNFGKQLSAAFEEERLWTSLGYNVSQTVRNLQLDNERIRLLRWAVEGVTKSSNEASSTFPHVILLRQNANFVAALDESPNLLSVEHFFFIAATMRCQSLGQVDSLG